MSTTDSGFVLYHYTPSKAAAIVFVVLFIIMTVIFAVQTLYAARKSSKALKIIHLSHLMIRSIVLRMLNTSN
ncbi:BDC_1c_G0016520.mRNA.1.CDS.1 [Saccharomyces cerevisiae]|nr:BDC_1c_G0016520.mRNA.1.CDS.1 [Saccharomyces cerevisiae]CAI7108235.1 BDC_1c_G0016520.mRNA.1.CDS.1 [Saccharomyces cerevisiae]